MGEDDTMKNTATIGIAALLVGAAGGYLTGKSGDPSKTSAEEAAAMLDTKSRSRPGDATRAGGNTKQRERTLSDILREPGQLARMQALMDLYAGMDASQLAAEAAKLDDLPMAQRMMASFLLFGKWGEIDPHGALAQANTMGMGGMFVRPTILQSWASVDPANAAKYFSENPREFAAMGGFGRGRGGESGSSVIAAEWAKLDPDAALTWANTLDGRDKSSALNSVISEMAATDPTKAAQIAATLTGDDQVRAYGEIASKWAATDFGSAESWVQGLPADARDRAMSELLQTLASTDPEAAAAKLSSITEGRDYNRAMEDIAGDWARSDPGAAADWIAEVNPEDPDGPIREVMSSWAGQDSAAALSWIESQPQGQIRDEATSTYIFANRTADPQESIQLAESISNDRNREQSIRVAASRWMREDREAATSYIQESTTLDDNAKQRLIEGRGGWGGRGRGRN